MTVESYGNDLAALIRVVDRLMDAEDPEEEPYRSKYEARRLIEEWVKNSGPADYKDVHKGRISLRLGKIGLDTEEPHEAEQHLSAALEAFVPGLTAHIKAAVGEGLEETAHGEVEGVKAPDVRLRAEVLASLEKGAGSELGEEALDALNAMGILWTQREQLRRALLYLLAAQDLYRQLDPLYPTAASSGDAAQSASKDGTFRRKVDDHFTHTLFFLAQVYGNLRSPHLAAYYCQQTLQRQLEYDLNLDTLAWVSNCTGFVDYLLNQRDDLASAAHCLTACATLLSERLPAAADPEQVSIVRGDLSRRWAALYLTVLRDASEAREAKALAAMMQQQQQQQQQPGNNSSNDNSRPEPPPSASSPPPAPAADEEALSMRFRGLKLEEVEVPDARDVVTYDQAREVFLKASKHLEEAKKVFVLEGYVTDHVNLLRDTSRLYRALSSFETDEKRRQAMYIRRCALLQPVISQTNPQAYEALHKQVSFEVGEICMELLDMKVARIEEKMEKEPGYHPKKAEAEKCNEYCAQAISAFEHFCSMYQQPGDTNKDSKVWALEKDDLRPVLRARFHLARLYGKMNLFATGAVRVEAAKRSLDAYESLQSFAVKELRTHCGGDASMFATELRQVEDMIRLLPEKIGKMHYLGQNFSV